MDFDNVKPLSVYKSATTATAELLLCFQVPFGQSLLEAILCKCFDIRLKSMVWKKKR